MAEVYFPTYPEKTTPVASDVGLLADSQDLDVDGKKKFKRYKLGNVDSLVVASMTHAQVEALVADSDLVIGQNILITDATQANIPLLVEAIAVNKIHTDAKSPDFPQDVIEYDFTNDVITWRWDTINDISVAQDLRNLQGLTIGSGGTNIHTGMNCTGSIAANCTDIIFGRGSSFIIPTNTRSIQAGNFCVYENTVSSQELQLFDYAEVRANNGISRVTFRASFNGLTSSNPTPVYNNSGSVQLSDDPTIFYYFIGTTLTAVSVD